MANDTNDIASKLYSKFELEVQDLLQRELQSHRLKESGQPRVALRNAFTSLLQISQGQLDPQNQIKLYLAFAGDFVEAGEHQLALECFDLALSKTDEIPHEVTSTRYRVELLQNIVKSNFSELSSAKSCRIAPMSVSKLLICLQELRKTVDSVFVLSTRSQEELAWQVINSCKLIMEIAQPLVWYSCGKYVTETVVFATLAMEAVINLCTVRHMKFRMKMYSTAFCALLVQGAVDEAAGMLHHTANQVKELRAREEIDPPVPVSSLECLQQCDQDVAVMQVALDFWRDPDSLDLSPAHLAANYYKPANDTSSGTTTSLTDYCVCECIRLHLLASGNINEPYRKRSACVLKAVVKVLSGYSPSESPGSLAALFSLQTLLEIALVAVLEVVEGVDVPGLLLKIWGLANHLVATQQSGDHHEEEASDLALLQKLVAIEALPPASSADSAESSTQRVSLLSDFVAQLESLMHRSEAYRKKAFIRKTAAHFWNKSLYPAVQLALSSFDAALTGSLLAEITPSVFVATKALDLMQLEDAVLLAGMALVSANLLWVGDDLRGAVALLKQALHNVDEQRAALVDVSLHAPEDVRDVHALQRASFSTRSDDHDWFHSVKRLGAHAFAGFGVFGLASSADRSDQAIAEMHADLAALYFRFELEYCARCLSERSRVRQAAAKLEKQKEKAAAKTVTMKPPAKNQTVKKSATGNLSQSAVKTSGTAVQEDSSLDVEKLSVVPSLRTFCLRNAYYKCVLLLELARLDSDEQRRRAFLHEAFCSIQDCESDEKALRDAFQQLTVMTLATRAYPLVLARSHRYLYVVPVGCRKLAKADYYRVFAKEKGSGTEVSIHNDDIAGCERRVAVRDLKSLKDTVVRVGPLRAGEQYVVGCVAFTCDDKPLGPVSPTSPVLGAVNPLSTILLWNMLNQVAGEVCSSHKLSRESALRVCSRYFLPTPALPVRTVGKGINLSLFADPALCMLALQQSSPVLLHAFVNSFIALELAARHGDGAESVSGRTNWLMRKQVQLSKLFSLHRTALATRVACSLAHHDLTLQCIKMGYTLCCELVRFDFVHLALILQTPLTVLGVALQSIPKKNWRALEHKLYCRILALLVKVASLNRNISPVVVLLNRFYPESLDKELALTSLPPPDLLHAYEALQGSIKQRVAASHLVHMTEQFAALHVALTSDVYAKELAASGVGFLWKMPAAQRRLKLTGIALEFVTPPPEKAPPGDRAQLETWIVGEKPEAMSDYLKAILQLGQELESINQSMLWRSLIMKVPIYQEFVAPELRAVHADWGLKVLQSVANAPPKPLSPRAAAAAKKAAGKPDPKAPAPIAPVEDPLTVPDRFTTVSAEERDLQLLFAAHLVFRLAVSRGADCAGTNHFPKSQKGPNMLLDPTSSALDVGLAGDDAMNDAVATDPDSAAFPNQLSRADYVRYVGAAVDMFLQSGAASSAVLAAVQLWNFVGSSWADPEQFATEFRSIAPCVHRITVAVVKVLQFVSFYEGAGSVEEDLAVADIAGSSPSRVTGEASVDSLAGDQLVHSKLNAADSASTAGQSNLTRREVKEHMLTLRELVVFLLKVKWLSGDHLHVVSLGSTLFQLFAQNCQEFCKVFGDHCLPLVMHSQETIVMRADEFLAAQQRALDDFVSQYEEAQRKKRKKKLRIARTDKDEEELLFDAECAVLQGRVDEAKAERDSCLAALDVVKTQQKKFDTMYSTGTQLLDKVRQTLTALLTDLRAEHGQQVDFRQLMEDETVQDRLDVTVYQFNQVVSFLREKKERLVLLQALKEQGDLLLLFGRVTAVRQTWHDAVDGLFNTIDSCANWRSVCDGALCSLEPHLVPGILPIVVILGKLSRFCVSGDWDAKSGYCRMAADLCRIPFQESYGHPQTLVGFAAYVCVDLGGLNALVADPDVLSPSGLAQSLEEVLSVLLVERQFVSAFPVVVLLEHLCAVYLRNASYWLRARVMRIRLLIGSHHFAEAASMLSGVKSSINAIHHHTFGDVLRGNCFSETESLSVFETSRSGLDFYGLASFANHLAPDDAVQNAKALEWVRGFAVDFEQFARSFRVALPEKELSTEEKQAAAEQQAAKAAAAAAEAKKSKGKPKAGGVEEPMELLPNSVPLFDDIQLSEISAVCGYFLLEVASLDPQSTSKQAASLAQLGMQGSELLATTTSALFACATSENITNSRWVDTYGRCQLLLIRYKMHRRKFRDARVALSDFCSFLRSEVFSDLSGDSKCVLCMHWFAANDLQIQVAERQARFEEAVALATQSATEACMVYSGFWLRSYLLLRATVQFKLGNFAESLQSIAGCVAQYELNRIEDLSLVRCLTLKASVLREQAVFASKSQASATFSECLASVRTAKATCESLAQANGAFPCDANVVYSRADTAVSTHHKINPVLDNLSVRHGNEPELSLGPTLDSKSTSVSLRASKVAENDSDLPNEVDCEVPLRLGPVDTADDAFSQSEFVNIYLAETRSLVTVSAALCLLLDDLRDSGARAQQAQEILDELELAAESALKLLRQCIYVSPATRVTLLHLAGKARISNAAKYAIQSASQGAVTLLGPSKAALNVSVQSSHLWELTRAICTQLVEAYGNQVLDLGDSENEARMHHAIAYLMGAVKAGNQLATIVRNAVGLNEESAFSSAVLSEELLSLLENSSCSSSTRKATEPEPVSAPLTKGAPPAKAAKGAPAVAAAGRTGRDALFLLSATLRECDPLWTDGHEQHASADMHSLLKKTHQMYSTRCSFEQVPDATAGQPVVPQTSVSTLWVPAKTPNGFVESGAVDHSRVGLYSHLAVFFLLGDKKAPVSAAPVPAAKGGKVDPAAAASAALASAASTEPVLTRVVLSRVDVVHLEKGLRSLRDRFLEAEAKKFTKRLRRCQEEFGGLLGQLVGLLRTGQLITPSDGNMARDVSEGSSGVYATFTLEDNPATPGQTLLMLSVPVGKKGTSVVQLVVSGQLMLNLASVLCPDRDSEALRDGEVCGLIRTALGYVDRV